MAAILSSAAPPPESVAGDLPRGTSHGTTAAVPSRLPANVRPTRRPVRQNGPMVFALIARLRPAPLLRASQQVLFCWAGALLVAGDAVFWLMFAAIQSDSGLAAMDGPVHSLMVDSRNPAATVLLAALTTVTSPEVLGVIGAVFAVAWALWKRELWRPAVLMGAMVLAVVLTTLIKQLVSRSRPPVSDFLLGPDDALSFPSGHTVGIGVFTVV